jgi:hypothetical protein
MKNKSRVSPYTLLGFILISIGIGLSIVAFFKFNSSLFTAIGIAVFVLGATTMLLPDDPIPPGNLYAMLRGSLYNLEAILEQFEAKERAIYLPRRGGRSRAYIPLGEVDNSLISKLLTAPPRLVMDVDRKLGLMIFLPIGEDLLNSIDEDISTEEALRHTLIEGLGLIKSLKETRDGGDIIIQMKGSTLDVDLPRYGSILGSIQTSIAGSVLANSYKAPISLKEENNTGKTITAIFRVIKDE